MGKSKKRIKKVSGERRYAPEGAAEDKAVGLLSSMRGGLKSVAGTAPTSGKASKVATVLLMILLIVAMAFFFTKGRF